MLPIDEILDSEAPPPLRPIGRSREGREILGTVLGTGPRHVSLTAAQFRPSSMEYVRSLGGDPFTFVSEEALACSSPRS